MEWVIATGDQHSLPQVSSPKRISCNSRKDKSQSREGGGNDRGKEEDQEYLGSRKRKHGESVSP